MVVALQLNKKRSNKRQHCGLVRPEGNSVTSASVQVHDKGVLAVGFHGQSPGSAHQLTLTKPLWAKADSKLKHLEPA